LVETSISFSAVSSGVRLKWSMPMQQNVKSALLVLEQMAASTKGRYLGILRNYLTPQFGGLALRDITTLSVDRDMAGLGGAKLAHESLDKIRDVLSSVLDSAVRYGLLVKNPAEGVRLPRRRGGAKAKPWITRPQFDALVELIAEPYASMVYVAVFTGLRVSELAGLRWRNVHEDAITIEERYCRGDWGAPKSEASNATIPVNRAVIERIHRLKLLTVEVKAGHATRRYRAVKSDAPEDLVFQSVSSGQPMRDNNILVRHIKPAARNLKLARLRQLALPADFLRHLAQAQGRGCEGRTGAHAA
jgi:integrase